VVDQVGHGQHATFTLFRKFGARWLVDHAATRLSACYILEPPSLVAAWLDNFSSRLRASWVLERSLYAGYFYVSLFSCSCSSVPVLIYSDLSSVRWHCHFLGPFGNIDSASLAEASPPARISPPFHLQGRGPRAPWTSLRQYS
jgi:hypothetical protein